jgi:methylmalonyl-CoA/ethylmalonyl-CoA epimerase
VTGDLRRIDHIGVLVRDTDVALRYFRDILGLAVDASETINTPPVQLTYLNATNLFIQLVEPLDDQSHLALALKNGGEGLHHVCFAVEDVTGTARRLGNGEELTRTGTGRGRPSAFVPGEPPHGFLVECTQFHPRQMEGGVSNGE